MVNYQGRFKAFLDGIFTLPLVLPPTVMGFFLLLLLGKNGPIGKLLASLGTSVIFSWQGAVIAAAAVSFPLMYKTSKSAFEQTDKNIINAARTLGISEWKTFWKISVPLAWPGIAAGAVLAFTRALGEFGATLMVAGSIPGKTQTIPLAIYFTAEAGEMDKALIWVLLILAVSFIVILLMNTWEEYQRKLTSSGGVK